jgi:DNA ligase (NAD+)
MDEIKLKEMRDKVILSNKASTAYYADEDEILSNYEWDKLFDEIGTLENELGCYFEYSPTRNVSSEKDFGESVGNLIDLNTGEILEEEIVDDADVDEDEGNGDKEPHEFPAKSLAKTKKVSDLIKWAKGKPIWLSWKLDGLTLVITYDDGKVTKVMKRGNGIIGTNITFMSDYIDGFPKEIPFKGHMVVRGEATISYDKFDEINMLLDEGEDPYKNPRNLVSGTLGLDTTRVQEVKDRGVHFNAFTLVYIEGEKIVSWGERMKYLEDLGFTVVEREHIENPADLQTYIDKWTKNVEDGKINLPVDGLVLAFDDTDYAMTGSNTLHHDTNAGIAFKWQDEAVESVLRDIEWSCATSTISPVAIFDPVQIEGTTVQRASLCNLSEMERLGIGANNETKLSIIKANKIIPKCIAANGNNTKFEIPSTCPVCRAATEIHIGKKTNTKTLHCSNPDCAAKHIKKYTRFVSKPAMNMDGISLRTLNTFLNKGFIVDFADLYDIAKYKDTIVDMDGFGEKSYDNLIKAIEKSRNVTPINFIYALNIPLIGIDAAKKIIAKCGTNGFFERLDNKQDFCDIDGIGDEKSNSILKWYGEAKNKDLVAKLLTKVKVEDVSPKTDDGNGRCANLVFVITGDVHIYKNRDEFKAYVEAQGGKVTGSVSKKTNYLVNNDSTSTSGKNKKAQELGIPVITEDEFFNMFAN